ncbi:hypothetical protein AGLY_004169 [Aphis glycines]|uniref:Uncharacterized protein n=1 Tax=Aphis glycines TaxID=307491 RepID=A0A6G0TXT9_APHGL|nr:hypothetical protein AGLY_004169 [Aphis glycines]
MLLLSLYVATCGAVSGSVDEFQCACGYNAAHHLRTMRAALSGGQDAAAAVELAAGYGLLVKRVLFVATSRPEFPTARWLWLFDLYANGARQQLSGVSGRRRRRDGVRWLSRAVDHVGRELNQYLTICKARGVGDDGSGRGLAWRDQVKFEKYVLEKVTAIVQQQPDLAGKDGRVREEDFEPRCLYLNDVTAVGADGLTAAGIMPAGVGVDWRSAGEQLSAVYHAAVRKWVFGTPELVTYQKKFVAAVLVTLMGHMLVHVEHCRAHRLLATTAPRPVDGAAAVLVNAVEAAADDRDHKVEKSNGGGGGGDGVPVGEYELTWMSVGALLDKYKSYLALGPDVPCYRTLVEVAANPARDDHGFRSARRAIESHMADLGAGLFGPVTTNWMAVPNDEVAVAVDKPKTLIELIALVDSNISAAEKYLKNVRDRLCNVDFKIVKKFMRSSHIWLL